MNNGFSDTFKWVIIKLTDARIKVLDFYLGFD